MSEDSRHSSPISAALPVGGASKPLADGTDAPASVPEEFLTLYDHVVTCSKCGFCQPVCPIFRATGREAHVARGKLALFRNLIERRTELGPELKDAYSNCLLCRACTDVCFSAVKTDKVVVTFRHQYAERFGRGFWQRRVFRSLLPRPRLMRALVRSLWALRRTGLPDLARRLGLVGLLNPKLERAMELSRGVPGKLLTSRLAARRRAGASTGAPATGVAPAHREVPAETAAPARPRVGYWMSCGYNYVLPQVGEATIQVLEELGYEVEVLDNCCCGLAAYGYGDLEAASRLAVENLRRLGDLERLQAVVSECGSCSGHLKEYGTLLANDPQWSGRAVALSSKTRSFSEFVAEQGGLRSLLSASPGEPQTAPPPESEPVPTGSEPGSPTEPQPAPAGSELAAAGEGGTPAAAAGPLTPTIVTYHDPCHLGKRYQNVVDQPRSLLRSLPGIVFREAAEADSCCGAAGTYGVLHPQTSAAIIDRKTDFFKATGATIIATECPACMMQLALGAKRAGLEVQVVNVSQLCAQALASRVSK
jgi:glycolate oxidase iron-sulfur subunit